MMYSKFSPEKATQAAAQFLKLHKNQTMNFLGLMKLLYTADRLAFEHLDESITGDIYVAMKCGPVLSNVYDLIKGKKIQADKNEFWSQHISRDHCYNLCLQADPGIDALSRAELKIINEAYQNNGHFNRFDLVEKIHQEFPEWQDPSPLKSHPIDIKDILRNLGKSEGDIQNINETMETNKAFDTLLNV